MSNISFTFRSHKQEVLEAETSALERTLYAIGLKMEKYAKEELSKPKEHKSGESPRPNVDTGRLRNSVVFATETDRSSGSSPADASDYSPKSIPERGDVYVGTNVEYAAYVEMGTSKMKAQPYLKPAEVDHADEYKQMVEYYLKSG
jgi:HK97 gp10 family phage protein